MTLTHLSYCPFPWKGCLLCHLHSYHLQPRLLISVLHRIPLSSFLPLTAYIVRYYDLIYWCWFIKMPKALLKYCLPREPPLCHPVHHVTPSHVQWLHPASFLFSLQSPLANLCMVLLVLSGFFPSQWSFVSTFCWGISLSITQKRLPHSGFSLYIFRVSSPQLFLVLYGKLSTHYNNSHLRNIEV